MTAPRGGRDPLFETLFRGSARPPAIASAPPVRQAGTRSRAGNAMSRTRAALLDGARRAVESSGTKITMAQVAASAGVAKATLYNHFRTREAVLAALVQDEVAALVEQFGDRPLADSLAGAATAICRHPLLRTLARRESDTLARIGTIDGASDGWRAARDAVSDALTRAGRGGADTVLRWLGSFVLTPATAAQIADDLAILVAGLPEVPAGRPGTAARTA